MFTILILSYCGFRNALSFKNVADSHIDAVEKFIRTNFSSVVKSGNEKDLYGQFFAKNPHNFVFLPGDRELIKQLASHVRDIVDQNGKNSGLNHFQLCKSQPMINVSEQQFANKCPYLLKKLLSKFKSQERRLSIRLGNSTLCHDTPYDCWSNGL